MQQLACPHCSAPHPVGSAPGIVHTCRNCARYYRLKDGQTVKASSPGTGKRSSAGALLMGCAVIVLLIVGVAGAAVFYVAKNAPTTPTRLAATATNTAAAAAATADLRFELHRKVELNPTTTHLIGMVHNLSSKAVARPEITVELLDAAKQPVDRKLGFASRDIVQPGQAAPVKIVLSNPPAHLSLRFSAKAQPALTSVTGVTGLEVTLQKPTQLGRTRWKLMGVVKHRGSQPTSSVNVEIAVFDAQDKLLAVETAKSRPSRMRPGSMGAFLASFHSTEPPGRIDAVVSAQP